MRRFSANYIFPITRPPIRNGIVTVNNDTIIDVTDPGDSLQELASMEFHNGVIVPGFVNSHCHLELSHLKGKIEPFGGIAKFVTNVRETRKATQSEIETEINQAISYLKSTGTVAVGDICNTLDSLTPKSKSNILFHNFIEIFGLNLVDVEDRFSSSMDTFNKFKTIYSESTSLTPHASYSISEGLWKLINAEISNSKSIVSIHYGESEQEYTLLKSHSGALAANFKAMGIPIENLPKGERPIDIAKSYLPVGSNVLFIHNTYVSKDELKELQSHFQKPYMVLCPTSNLFIEGVLPNVQLLAESGVTLALGTDSYASSNTISIFDQIMVLLERFPTLTFDVVLKWATLNGARALNFDRQVGSLEPSKKPGLNLITNFDFIRMKPTKKSTIKRLV